jgi:histidyl-tRNA synthetase
MDLLRVRGFNDLIGSWAHILTRLEECAREIMRAYSVSEIRIPLIERIELFERSTGDTSDIVQKQMFAFQDRDDPDVTLVLRPEGTPGVVRAYINAGFDKTQPEQRFFYSGPMFRRERPQRGRYRQFYQFGVEVLGRDDPSCDAEMLTMIDDLRKELRIEVRLEVNSIGDARCRPLFRAALLKFGKAHWDELCADCHQRLQRNPLRLLDCKVDAQLAQSAPKSTDYLCDDCRKHFGTVKELLSASNVEFKENPRLVRGLDYYSRTTFEVHSEDVGAQSAIAAGGRYDGLVKALGGADIPGIGFAIGLDRLALALEANPTALASLGQRLDPAREGASRRIRRQPKVALVALGDQAIVQANTLAREIRSQEIPAEIMSPARSLKSQLSQANTISAEQVIIIGEDELKRGVVQLRDLKKSEQHEVPLADVAAAIAAAPRT